MKPRWIWEIVYIGTLTVIIGIGLVVILLLSGTPFAGSVAWQDHDLAWADGPQITLKSGAGAWVDAPVTLPDGSFTLYVKGQLSENSDPSAAWGVWLETIDGSRVIYAISGEKMITTRLCSSPTIEIEDCPAVRPEWRWFDYNRLRGPGHDNSITLHLESGSNIRLHLNDEKMGISPVERSGRWGVWVRGGRDGEAVLSWKKAVIYAP